MNRQASLNRRLPPTPQPASRRPAPTRPPARLGPHLSSAPPAPPPPRAPPPRGACSRPRGPPCRRGTAPPVRPGAGSRASACQTLCAPAVVVVGGGGSGDRSSRRSRRGEEQLDFRPSAGLLAWGRASEAARPAAAGCCRRPHTHLHTYTRSHAPACPAPPATPKPFLPVPSSRLAWPAGRTRTAAERQDAVRSGAVAAGRWVAAVAALNNTARS